MKIILASASPRRQQLLKDIVQDFDVLPSMSKEEHPDLPPKKFVKKLSMAKAQNVFDFTTDKGQRLIIGSDTIVVLKNKIIGKPTDKQNASKILNELSGRVHTVYTGVCIMTETKQKCFVSTAKVKFFSLSQSQIDNYISTGSPMDKAGAYGIQDSGFVKKIYGSVSCVMGLPKEKLLKALKSFGVDVKKQ